MKVVDRKERKKGRKKYLPNPVNIVSVMSKIQVLVGYTSSRGSDNLSAALTDSNIILALGIVDT